MDECASMLIGQDPFRIDQHWQRLTLLGEYDTHRAGMLVNRRPDGSFTNW